MKFKFGDVVRVIGNAAGAEYGHEFNIGSIVVVYGVDDDPNLPYGCINADEGSWWVAEADIEKVEAEQ